MAGLCIIYADPSFAIIYVSGRFERWGTWKIVPVDQEVKYEKVAWFMDGWKRYFIYAWPLGLMQKIKDANADVNLYIFNSNGNWNRYFGVTGFDNFDKAAYYTPRITTVSRIREKIGYAAAEIMLNIWAGNNPDTSSYIDYKCIFTESCGCGTDAMLNGRQYLKNYIMGVVEREEIDESTLDFTHLLSKCGNYSRLYPCVQTAYSEAKCKKCVMVVISIKDPLPQIYNREGMRQIATKAFDEAARQDKALLVMFADMDKLKYINDNYGHEYGDKAIRSAARAIAGGGGINSIPVRYGGDEFVSISVYNEDESPEEMKAAILEKAKEISAQEKLPFELEFSIGYVVTEPNGEKSLEEYVREADHIMYQEKMQKRDSRIHVSC